MKQIRIILAVVLSMVLFTCAAAADVNTIETEVAEIKNYGQLVLGIPASGLLNQGYEIGDITTLTILGQELEVPVGKEYSDVDVGRYVLKLKIDETEDTVNFAVNMGNTAAVLGIAEKVVIDENPGFKWEYKVALPVAVTISMKEKGGYIEQYEIHQLSRTNNRSDYPDLTDEQFANFRNVATTGMGKHVLYRSSSPVDPELGRNTYADEALSHAGIKTVLNLTNNDVNIKEYEGFADSCYAKCNIICLGMGIDFQEEDFKVKLAEGLVFLAENEGPYLVHCTEGKDRAGFVSALLECLMGASADEVIADYMLTYYNYYGVKEGTAQYDKIVHSNIDRNIAIAFGVEDIREADLASCAEEFMLSIGITQEQLSAIKENLGKSYAE